MGQRAAMTEFMPFFRDIFAALETVLTVFPPNMTVGSSVDQ